MRADRITYPCLVPTKAGQHNVSPPHMQSPAHADTSFVMKGLRDSAYGCDGFMFMRYVYVRDRTHAAPSPLEVAACWATPSVAESSRNKLESRGADEI